MTLLVPYDGSELSEAALQRATQFGEAFDQEVVVLVVVPTDEDYVRERGLVDEGEEYDSELFALELRDEAEKIAPDATFRSERATDPEDEPYASTTMNIVRTIRQVAGELDAEIVFLGSENAASVSQPLSSIGAPVSNDPRYDVHIVRHPD
ncbi:universal stress protein [Natronomonas salina]|uniref:universal stress protein n=1 Tax=Natronomonas salina TaxID=1710540 RepID=UPI0015B72047|nr:universal stress protein [Natronomonas salina]QLD90242.1 universal stress protein [Natronomonas salina]